MRRFIISILVFASPILLMGICLELLLRHIPNDYSYKRTYLDQHSRELKILFLGSSHAFYGVDPEYIKAKSFNAAYVSQFPEYDLGILKKYSGRWDSLRYIVLPVDYFSLFSNLEKSDEPWRAKNYKIYYGIHLNHSVFDNFEILNTQLNVDIGRSSAYYRKNIYTLTCSNLGWGKTYKSEDKQDLNTTGVSAAKRHRAGSDQYFKSGVENLDSIIAFAKERNIKILIYTSPAYKTYYQNLDGRQLTQTINAATSATTTYNKAAYFNLLTDTSFVANDFFDADHLNEIGAKKLTLKLDSLLNTIQ